MCVFFVVPVKSKEIEYLALWLAMAAAADVEGSGSSDASRTGGSTARIAESQSAKSSMLGDQMFSARLQIS